MKRRTMAEGEEIVLAYKSSGLSRKEFVANAKITIHVLRYWLKRIRKIQSEAKDKTSCQFIEIENSIVQSSFFATICYDNLRIEFNELPSIDWIAQLNKALGRAK